MPLCTEKKLIKNILKKYDIYPESIHGRHVPDSFMMFSGFVSLAGRDVDLTLYKVAERKYSRHKELHEAQSAFKEDLYVVQEIISKKGLSAEETEAKLSAARDRLVQKHIEKLVHAYETALREELDAGQVQVLYVPKVFDPSATVKSLREDQEICFSPVLTTIVKPTDNDVIKKTANLFAHAYLESLPCNLMSVYIGKNLSEEDVLRVYDMMEEIFAVLNAYFVYEFYHKKDNKKYQHRNDWRLSGFWQPLHSVFSFSREETR